MEDMTIGIVGYGFVGKAVGQFKDVLETFIYDPYNSDYNSLNDKKDAYNADIVFINVPTDLIEGRLNTTIIEACMIDFKEVCNSNNSTLVIKSTLPIGTCNNLKSKYDLDNIVFNPEFLTQRTAMQDFLDQKEVYLAGSLEHTEKVKHAYKLFFNHYSNLLAEIFQTESYKEIEMLKLARNTFYSVKVSYCNNLYNLCEKENIDYSLFRKHFARAEWVGQQHTHVPGPDEKFGYGGKCLPKDSTELLNFSKNNGIIFDMLEKSIQFNKSQRQKETKNA